MSSNRKKFLIAASIAGLMAAVSTPAHAEQMAPADGKVPCYGVNACKGHGECGGKGYSCAGNNACKGQGWVSMAPDACTKIQGGSLTAS